VWLEQVAAVSLRWLFVRWEQVAGSSLVLAFQVVEGEALH